MEVKALKKPPAGVRLTLKAVCIMFQIKSVKAPDPDNPQKKIDDYWGPSQKLLNDLGPDKFKQALIDFDKDNIPDKVIKKVGPYIENPDFTPKMCDLRVLTCCGAFTSSIRLVAISRRRGSVLRRCRVDSDRVGRRLGVAPRQPGEVGAARARVAALEHFARHRGVPAVEDDRLDLRDVGAY